MIKANELRIGNLIMSPDTKHPVVVEINHLLYIAGDEKYYGEYEPVPLTPEILEAAGFKIEDKLNVGAQTYFKDGMGEYLTYHYDGFCVYESSKQPVIKSLHQLQNLYFALTGQELEIKLPVTA